MNAQFGSQERIVSLMCVDGVWKEVNERLCAIYDSHFMFLKAPGDDVVVWFARIAPDRAHLRGVIAESH